jgi:hypothetical protein
MAASPPPPGCLHLDGHLVTKRSLQESGIAETVPKGKVRKVSRSDEGQLWVQDIPRTNIEASWHLEDQHRRKKGLAPIKHTGWQRSIVNPSQMVCVATPLGFGRFGSSGWSPVKVLGNVTKPVKVTAMRYICCACLAERRAAGHVEERA